MAAGARRINTGILFTNCKLHSTHSASVPRSRSKAGAFTYTKKNLNKSDACYQHVLLSPQCFTFYLGRISPFEQCLICRLQMLSVWTYEPVPLKSEIVRVICLSTTEISEITLLIKALKALVWHSSREPMK